MVGQNAIISTDKEALCCWEGYFVCLSNFFIFGELADSRCVRRIAKMRTVPHQTDQATKQALAGRYETLLILKGYNPNPGHNYEGGSAYGKRKASLFEAWLLNIYFQHHKNHLGIRIVYIAINRIVQIVAAQLLQDATEMPRVLRQNHGDEESRNSERSKAFMAMII